MPKVFVQGNPENSTLWSVLFDELGKRGVSDVVALSPPGFGAPVPEGFDATRTGSHAMCEAVAGTLGAMICRLEGLGHWWMFAGAAPAADALLAHWEADAP